MTRRPEVATIPQLNETQARAVGSFIARCGLDDTVDVTVAEAAMRRDDAIVTSN